MSEDNAAHPLEVRCAIYTRQSVARDGDPAIASCKVQRAKCIAFIQSMAWRGWFVAGEHFDDEGESGATTDRPGLARLLERIEEGEVQRVIVYRLDRLTRRLADWAKLAALFDRHDVGLTVVHRAIDAEGGSLQRFQLNMLATFAEMERDLIAERIADARRARSARGERSAGRVPLGYVSDPRTKQLVVAKDEARVVRRLFRLTAAGTAPTDIALDANKRGLPNKQGSEVTGRHARSFGSCRIPCTSRGVPTARRRLTWRSSHRRSRRRSQSSSRAGAIGCLNRPGFPGGSQC